MDWLYLGCLLAVGVDPPGAKPPAGIHLPVPGWVGRHLSREWVIRLLGWPPASEGGGFGCEDHYRRLGLSLSWRFQGGSFRLDGRDGPRLELREVWWAWLPAAPG